MILNFPNDFNFMFSPGVWDQLIKTRISLQNVVSLCNQLPQSETWADFEAVEGFRHEAKNGT